MRFSTTELAVDLHGESVGPEVDVNGVSIDSRATVTGQLFIPIIAERDGHDFIAAALDAGAAAYLTSRSPVGGSAVIVEDTGAALTTLGVAARERLDSRIIGITGSVGKTTTKDLVAACLRSTFRTAASARSLNNELGVPLTLVNAAEDVQCVVLEMGARGPGHITALTDTTRPHVGVVTSVAMAHVEFFGDLEGVFRAKGELVRSLPADGLAVLNQDDPYVRRMAADAACPVLTYGLDATAEVTAEAVSLDDDLRPRFTLVTPWGRGEVALALHGAHQVSNALAAAGTALWCGVPLAAVLAALAGVVPSSLRMDVRHPRRGPVLVVDCYNANPASTESALRSLAALGSVRKVALLGMMAELGTEAPAQHARMASLAQSLGIEVVGYRTDLYGPTQVTDVEGAVACAASLTSEDALLVKGSRMARLEEVIAGYGRAIGDESLSGAH